MKHITSRLLAVPILIVLGLIGLGTKLYRGRAEIWFHNYAGGIIYEVFWIVLFGALLARVKAWRIALSVFLVTCGLETLQLYHPPLLEAIRSKFLGRALIGNAFDPWDFAYYELGSAIGWLMCHALRPGRDPSRISPKRTYGRLP